MLTSHDKNLQASLSSVSFTKSILQAYYIFISFVIQKTFKKKEKRDTIYEANSKVYNKHVVEEKLGQWQNLSTPKRAST